MQVGTREALDAFLAAHPTGFYANLAHAQRAKLLAAAPAVPATAPVTAPPSAAAPVPTVSPPPRAEPEKKRGKTAATRHTDPPAARAKQKPAKDAAPSADNKTRSSSSSGCGVVRRAVAAGTAAGLDNGAGLIAFARRSCAD
jgi:hypothetical protein